MSLSESKELQTGSAVIKHVGRPGCRAEWERKIREHFNKLSEAKCALPYQSGIAAGPWHRGSLHSPVGSVLSTFTRYG